jgi:predicted nucleic acid-binding protein
VTRYLLDTNILSDLIRNPQGKAARRIAKVGEDGICTSIQNTARSGRRWRPPASRSEQRFADRRAGKGVGRDHRYGQYRRI